MITVSNRTQPECGCITLVIPGDLTLIDLVVTAETDFFNVLGHLEGQFSVLIGPQGVCEPRARCSASSSDNESIGLI